MTGFASITREDDRATIAVTMRSVNHRYLDLQLRVPQSLAAIESDVRALVGKYVARGRVEVGLSFQLRQVPGVDVEFNETFGAALEKALDQARSRGLVTGALTPGDLLRLPQALTIRERPIEADEAAQEEIAARARAVVGEALADLDAMRAREGRPPADRPGSAPRLCRRPRRTRGRGRRRRTGGDGGPAPRAVRELREELQADETAVAQEIVRSAARSDISEEVSRFRAHISHWVTLSDSAEPCGRKLDFLLQEMNREVNTMGSKADGLRVSELIIAAKAELEKMREQVQNVE